MEALLWLKYFLGFFKKDYEQWQTEENDYLQYQLNQQLSSMTEE
jgi:hypothetical protein